MGNQKDFSQLARVLVDHMAGEVEPDTDQEKPHVRAGRKGGQVRAKTLSVTERATIASQGGQARWAQP